jgi:RNA polymerase sigma factor (TIGR02999 family)
MEGGAEKDQRPRMDEALLERVYEELHRIAASKLRHERGHGSLQTTELVHEAWLRLRDQEKLDWSNKDQFACLAARAIRRILVDRARARSAQKRAAPGERVDLSNEIGELGQPLAEGVDFVALDHALARLSHSYERAARVVELRFFGGMTELETARALALSERTVAGDWAFARAWLRRALEGGVA